MNRERKTAPQRGKDPAEESGRGRVELHAWLERAPGKALLDAEAEAIRSAIGNLFGFHLVQVGRLGTRDLLDGSRVQHRTIVEIDGLGVGPLPDGSSMVRGRPDALAVESDSTDVVILPHVLEFESRPHDSLREAFRVLIPEGHLLIAGFNPWSLLGAWRLVLRRRGTIPWRGEFLGLARIRDWLALLGFDVVRVAPCFFRPPFSNEALLERLEGLESIGARMLPYVSGAYVVLARKRVTTLTPMRPNWTPRRRLVAVGLAEPSTRVLNGD